MWKLDKQSAKIQDIGRSLSPGLRLLHVDDPTGVAQQSVSCKAGVMAYGWSYGLPSQASADKKLLYCLLSQSGHRQFYPAHGLEPAAPYNTSHQKWHSQLDGYPWKLRNTRWKYTLILADQP